MSVDLIRSAIQTVMQSVADIGVVHAYQRYAADLVGLKALYLSVPHQQLRGWYIQRAATGESGGLPPRGVEVIRWKIQGFMALDDSAASELQMDALIEALRAAFRDPANRTLGGLVAHLAQPRSTNQSGPIGLQLDEFGPVSFAGVLCHSARCALTTTRYL